MPITVAIVEDNEDLRLGNSYILKSSPACRVVGEYADAEDFLDEVKNYVTNAENVIDQIIPQGRSASSPHAALVAGFP